MIDRSFWKLSQTNQKEGAPEEEIRDGDDEEHLDSGHPLPVDPVQVVLHLHSRDQEDH